VLLDGKEGEEMEGGRCVCVCVSVCVFVLLFVCECWRESAVR
jgi:hypothetical protein